MRVKKIIAKIHLWLGLSSGLLVVFLGITGCILAYQREIEDFSQDYRFVNEQTGALLPPSSLREIAERRLKNKHAHSVRYEKGLAAQVVFYNSGPDYYYVVYINPYTGQVLKVKDMATDFFRFVIMGHYYLWLPPEIGQPIVASATLIFLFMLISGIILWWPKNAAARKKRFTIKLNAKWRRVNYDLHNVLGYYITWIAIFIALTGLVMGFQWFSNSVYWIASGGKSAVEYYPVASDSRSIPLNSVGQPVDVLWSRMASHWEQTGGSMEVHIPEGEKSSIEIAFNPATKTYWKTDYRYYDRYTYKEISVNHIYGNFAKATSADKLIRMNYDIHVGAIAGLAGKTLAFFASLLAASLPVTGFLIWRGRKRKSKSADGSTLKKIPVLEPK